MSRAPSCLDRVAAGPHRSNAIALSALLLGAAAILRLVGTFWIKREVEEAPYVGGPALMLSRVTTDARIVGAATLLLAALAMGLLLIRLARHRTAPSH
jgi:hypothetical protein